MKKSKNLSVVMLLLLIFSFAGCPMDAKDGEPLQQTQRKQIQEQQEQIQQEKSQESTPQQERGESLQQEQESEQEQEQEKTIFEGAWITNTINNSFAVFEFTGSNFVYFSNSTGMYFRSGSFTGTFEFTKKMITFTTADNIFIMYYSFQNNGGILVFEDTGSNRLLYADFEKLTKQQ
jgi:hypothetical protein